MIVFRCNEFGSSSPNHEWQQDVVHSSWEAGQARFSCTYPSQVSQPLCILNVTPHLEVEHVLFSNALILQHLRRGGQHRATRHVLVSNPWLLF